MSVSFKAPVDLRYQSFERIINAQLVNSVHYMFERQLSQALCLTKVPGPLFVAPETGLNDDLNGTENKVSFDLGCDRSESKQRLEVVQSLAKWKRWQLDTYKVEQGKGIVVDMKAIRRDDDLDNVHSSFVDQWDWE